MNSKPDSIAQLPNSVQEPPNRWQALPRTASYDALFYAVRRPLIGIKQFNAGGKALPDYAYLKKSRRQSRI
jgi:hypothetical protein